MANSREKLIQAAIDLILSRGFSSTTVDEICAAAGVAKGSFYYAFDSKEELGVAAMEAFDAHHNDEFGGSGFLDEPDPLSRFLMLLDFMIAKADTLFKHGCLLGNMALDISEEYPLIRKRLSEIFETALSNFEALIAPCLENAQAKSMPTARELSEKLAVQIEGALVMARATGDWSFLTRMLKIYRAEFVGLTGPLKNQETKNLNDTRR